VPSRWFYSLCLAAGVWSLSVASAWASINPIEVNVDDTSAIEQVSVNTDLTNYRFSAQGGVLESVYLQFKTFNDSTAELIPDVETDPETKARLYPQGMDFPFLLSLDSDKALYDYKPGLGGDNWVELVFRRVVGDLEITKRYKVYNDQFYHVGFTLTLKNVGDKALDLDKGYTMNFTSGLAALQDKDLRESYLFDGKHSLTVPAQYGRFGGIGYVGGRLALFLKNEDPAGASNALAPWISIDARGRKLLGVRAEPLSLNVGETVSHDLMLYAGRLKYVLMEHFGLGEVAGLGPFSQFLVPMIKFLDWLYAKLGNYGWAILVFTLLTRVLLFPLIRQQFHSMAKMRDIQPKMTRMRERYPGLGELRKAHPGMDAGELQARARENREKLNKKMMELYQREGVNPLGGCLPSLLQFPFLIVLWRTITYSSESIHFSPGFLWLNDLSQADPLFILVVLTVGVMMLQTKLTPQMGSASQNQWMMWVMPLFMGFFLKDFPAGLWLYYFLTTALQVAQQAFINWEIAQKKPVPVSVEASDEEG